MRKIQIFLASSIVEFQEERLILHDFVQRLQEPLREKHQTMLVLKKCENIDNRLEIDGKQKVYDQEICQSDMVVFLFGEKAGEYTLGELETACRCFLSKSLRNHVLVFCTVDPYLSKDPSLKKLTELLDEYRLPKEMFIHIEKVEVEILFNLLRIL